MKRLGHKRVWYGSGLLVLDMILFSSTNATKVPSPVSIIGFVLLVLTIYGAISCLLSLGRLYGIRVPGQRQMAIYASVLLGGMLALQSIGELDKRDIWVWLPLIVIGYVYSAYVKTGRRNLES